MLTLLRTLSVGYLGQHPTRSVLVVLSIALGVATLVATQALSKGINKGIQEGVNPIGHLADLLVVNGQSGVPAGMAKELREAGIPGLKEVTPFVYWRMSVADLDNKVVWLLGVEWPHDAAKKQEVHEGANPLGVTVRRTYTPRGMRENLRLLLAPPALVNEGLLAELKKKVPAADEGKGPLRFRLRNAGLKPEVTVFGTVDFSGSQLPLKDSNVVIMDLMSAAAIVYPDDPDHINQIGITIEKAADRNAVQRAVEERLGQRAQVQTINDSQGLVSDVTAGLQIGFTIGGAGALVVGLFLVYNALSVSVAERRHDIGILRSVGATRAQISGLFVGEATVMGLVGSALGLPLGWLLSWLAIRPLAGVVTDLLVPIDSAGVELSWGLMVVAVLSGTLVADLAALVPAMQAAGEEPADAVRRVPRRSLLLYALLQIAGMVLLLGAGFLLAGFRQDLPERMGMFAGIVCLLLGGLIATPLLASLVGRFVQPLFRYFLGLEGRLAADNLVRSPGRTGLVVAALAATGGLMVQTAGFLKSSRLAIHEWVEDKIAADLFVTSGSAVTSGGAALSMQESMLDHLKEIDGVQAILPVRFHRLDYNPSPGEKRIVFLIALQAQEFLQNAGDRPLARALRGLEKPLGSDRVLVSENFAALYKKRVGDWIELPGRTGPLPVEIVGTVVDYTWNRGTIIVDRDWYREEFNDRQVDVFDLFLKPGADVKEVRREIMDRYGAAEALFAVTRPEVNQDVKDAMQKIYALAYAQQTVVGLVALLGVVSALFISVLQRRRELGLLRAVGASRAQILRSVLAEAVLMGVIGALVGFGIGLLLEWYVLDVMLLDESGFTFPMRIPWSEAGVVSLASVALATLAGLWPAYLATRLRIPEAIAYE
jgi:putative ABC transport system permease protein